MQECLGDCIAPLFDGDPDTEALCYLFKLKQLNHPTVYLEEEGDCDVPGPFPAGGSGGGGGNGDPGVLANTLTPTEARATGVEVQTTAKGTSPDATDPVEDASISGTTTVAGHRRCVAHDSSSTDEWDVKEAELAVAACMEADPDARQCLATGFTDCVCVHAASSISKCVGPPCWAAWWGSRTPQTNKQVPGAFAQRERGCRHRAAPNATTPAPPHTTTGETNTFAANVNGSMQITFEWPTLFLGASDAADDAAQTHQTLLKHVASLLTSARSEHTPDADRSNNGITAEYAVRTTVLPMFASRSSAPKGDASPPSGGAQVDHSVHAYHRIQQAIYLAADRYYSRLNAADHNSNRSHSHQQHTFRLKNVNVHVVHGADALAYEMAHTSSNHVGVSGVYCLQANEQEDYPIGSQLMFFDPRNGMAELYPLPYVHVRIPLAMKHTSCACAVHTNKALCQLSGSDAVL